MEDDVRLVEIYAARDNLEAHFLRSLLEEQGLEVRVVGEGLAFAIGDLPLGLPTMPRLWAREEDAPKARALIAEWEEARRKRREAGEEDSESDPPE